jgi:hypothetical protein
VDLKDAYLHVPLHQEHRKFFQFKWRGKLYQFNSLPFGWSRSPQWFQSFTRHIASICRRRGIRMVCYLDDFLILASTKSEAEEATRFLLLLLLHFGFTPNVEKTETSASQTREFLGTIVDSRTMTLSVPKAKLKRYRAHAKRMLRKVRAAKPVSVADLQSLVGKLQSCSQCVLVCRLRLNGLISSLNKALDRRTDVLLSEEATQDLIFWADFSDQWNGKGTRPFTPRFRFTTDAGPLGWGGFTIHRKQQVETQGRFLQLQKLDSTNEKELLAIYYCLRAFVHQFGWSGCKTLVITDSMTALIYINKMGGRVPSLVAVTTLIHDFALEHQIHLRAEYISTLDNKIADRLSRKFDNPQIEFMLNPSIFTKLDLIWGPHQVDCFASMNNCQLQHYVSWLPDPFSLYPDFMSKEAPEGRLYAFPPFSMVLPTLTKLARESRTATVVIPFWPTRPFWPVLLSLLTDWPILLPLNPLSLPRGVSDPSMTPPDFQLIACSISGNQPKRRDFQKQRGSMVSNATKPTGQASLQRFRHMNALFASTRSSELLELILLPSSPWKAS